MTAWTEERIAELRRHWETGLSASEFCRETRLRDTKCCRRDALPPRAPGSDEVGTSPEI